ncbi:MAG TPA: hypothetical protein VI893_08725 [Thermoplasmata archaeon]|nr:hypothetical protein [Thermoplasmata archaeon]
MPAPARRGGIRAQVPRPAQKLDDDVRMGVLPPVAPGDPQSMRQEIESLRAEVKELRRSMEMLLSMVIDGEAPRTPTGQAESDEIPPFYN